MAGAQCVVVQRAAQPICEIALNEAEAKLPAGHPMIARYQTRLGDACKYNVSDSSALTHYHEARRIYEQHPDYGTNHPRTADSYMTLAVVYNKLDRQKALEYYGKVLAIRESRSGANNEAVAHVHHSMSIFYHNLHIKDNKDDDLAEALKYRKLALEGHELHYGTDHPTTAGIYYGFAEILRMQGDTHNAVEYHKKALAIREKHFGADHRNTNMSRRGYIHVACLALGTLRVLTILRNEAGRVIGRGEPSKW
eukprot:SAG11_NODE_1592_length_4617_cov_6.925631_2_plen_252_part_00